MTCATENFSNPMQELQGLSCAFDYKNARFVLSDHFPRKDGSNNNGTSNDNMLDQLDWIESELKNKNTVLYSLIKS